LLGELRKEKKAYRLIPALEVKTKAGWRTIPVEQIVEFSGTSATSTPAQKN